VAHTALFVGLQDAVWKVTAAGTPPPSETEGITPDLDDAYAYPPKYQGTWPTGTDAPWDAFELPSGLGTPGSPSPGFFNFDGYKILGFEGDLYYRIHVNPVRYDLGNVLQPESRVVEVWNAWPRTAKTLTAIVETGTTGITLIEPGATPLVFNPLNSKDYTLEISEEGPADILANYLFNFGAEQPEHDVTGSRVVAFAFCPQRPIREGLEFKTDILESYAGNERRIRGRRLPRQQFEYNYIIKDDQARSWAHNAIAGHHGRAFAVPVFPMMRQLTSDISAGVSTIPVDTTNADFREPTTWTSELIMLWRDWDDFEVVQVSPSGVSPSSIAIERPTIGAHEAWNTHVIPVQVMYSRDPIEWDESRNNVMFLGIGWLSEAIADLGDLSSLPTHDGLSVLTGYNFMDNRLSEKVTRKYDLVDQESGVFSVLYGRTITEFGSVKGFEPKTDADCWTMRKILYGLNGKQTAFFLPSYRNDFQLRTTIGASATVISVETVGYDRFIETADPYGDIMIELNDGTQFFRNITLSELDPGGFEKITINTSLGQEVAASDIRFFSYLYRVRLNTDKLEIEHKHLSEMSVRIPVAGVKE
jgi:hypothetical protein